MGYYVYVLRSQKDNRFYTGMTKNLEKRIKDHNNGRVDSTKSRTPLDLIHVEKVEDRKAARVREKYWKSGAGREKISRPAYGQV